MSSHPLTDHYNAGYVWWCTTNSSQLHDHVGDDYVRFTSGSLLWWGFKDEAKRQAFANIHPSNLITAKSVADMIAAHASTL